MPQEEEGGGEEERNINMLCVTTQKSDVYIVAEARSLSTVSLLVGKISFTRLKF